MAQRPIKDHREALVETQHLVGPKEYASRLQVLEAQEAYVAGHAHEAVENAKQKADAYGSEAFERTTNMTSSATEFAAEVRSGRVEPAEARKRLRELRRDLFEAANRRSQFEKEAAFVTQVEADPLGWIDGVQRKFPASQTEVPW